MLGLQFVRWTKKMMPIYWHTMNLSIHRERVVLKIVYCFLKHRGCCLYIIIFIRYYISFMSCVAELGFINGKYLVTGIFLLSLQGILQLNSFKAEGAVPCRFCIHVDNTSFPGVMQDRGKRRHKNCSRTLSEIAETENSGSWSFQLFIYIH